LGLIHQLLVSPEFYPAGWTLSENAVSCNARGTVAITFNFHHPINVIGAVNHIALICRHKSPTQLVGSGCAMAHKLKDVAASRN
jgi:hypothetical protein